MGRLLPHILPEQGCPLSLRLREAPGTLRRQHGHRLSGRPTGVLWVTRGRPRGLVLLPHAAPWPPSCSPTKTWCSAWSR